MAVDVTSIRDGCLLTQVRMLLLDPDHMLFRFLVTTLVLNGGFTYKWI